jgi:hypothetical protein
LNIQRDCHEKKIIKKTTNIIQPTNELSFARLAASPQPRCREP